MKLEVMPLDKSHIPEMKFLIAGYLNSSSNGIEESESSPELLEQCDQILNRLLSDNSAFCFVATQEYESLGFIVLSWSFSLSKGYPVLRIEALYSSPGHRKKGVGRKLLQHAIDLAYSKKAARLQLETDEDNVPARALYKKLGFTLIQGKDVYMSFLPL
ncbi:GNAT family N-acetyltransferase [Paenibacillus sp. JDR-2]|uniref:GNAT family N-acetyltransferase n=1 Tax=Paenibacillus sp. (strain JDR-2) TaxID=324057 RepID=UPI0001663E9C|nr:GNAT family N-acetyltransferase [Paenibacillus sp. JDR-2]ACT02678.1 GCN5-related N-acetyltransferase [Paenibacillus sp. JDR-2]